MSEIEERIHYAFNNKELLIRALTHKSRYFEAKELMGAGHNEKLEFLGDAVVDLVLSEYLMDLFPEDLEGNLSKKRASLVNENVLSEIARTLDLQKCLHLGKGEMLSGGDQKPRLLASVFEALVGAIFLDGGFDQAKKFLRRQFAELIQKMNPLEDFSLDYKTKLQELTQATLKEAPLYRLVSEAGPAHKRTFEVEVVIRSQSLAKASGNSKKAAEQSAARLAIDVWIEKKGQA